MGNIKRLLGRAGCRPRTVGSRNALRGTGRAVPNAIIGPVTLIPQLVGVEHP